MATVEVTTENIKDFYDKRYALDYMEGHHWLEVVRVSQTLAEIHGDIKFILDYGCGQGRWIKLQSEQFPEARITGIDISNKAVEKAGIMFPYFEFRTYDGRTAPFGDSSFDLIFSHHVFEHVSDIESTVVDIARLLKSGGYACIIFPCGNEKSFEERIVKMINGGKEASVDRRIRFFYEDAGHIRRMKSEEIIRLFENHGIKLYRAFYASQFWGAVEWITRTSPIFINEFLNTQRAVNMLAWLKLMALRIIFSILVLRNYPFIFGNKSLMKKIILVVLIPLKGMMKLAGSVFEWFAYLEWRFRREAPNGSEQFLIFRK